MDERNVKGLYRLALAHESKQDFEEAWKYIGLAKKYDQENIEIFEKYKQLK